jgi:hypothetical protein
MSEEKQNTVASEYQQIADEMLAARKAFEQTYTARVPAPQPPAERHDDRVVMLALAVMLGASMLVSASRTVGEFSTDAPLGVLIGLAAFLMLEVGMVAYAFVRTSRDYTEARHAALGKWINGGLILAFLVLLAGNIDSIFGAQELYISPVVDTVIQLAIAVSAPVLAFITGDVLGAYSVQQRQRRKKDTDKYTADMQAWHDKLNAAWTQEKNSWGFGQKSMEARIQRLSAPPVRSRSTNEQANEPAAAVKPVRSHSRSVNSANGYSKNMSAADVAREYLDSHSEQRELWTMTVDQLLEHLQAQGIDVKRTTVFKVRKELLSERQANEQTAADGFSSVMSEEATSERAQA